MSMIKIGMIGIAAVFLALLLKKEKLSEIDQSIDVYIEEVQK